jgi:chromatin segregation and condensation protein Rec8/ScpA/Scc1 (kleisin family)
VEKSRHYIGQIEQEIPVEIASLKNNFKIADLGKNQDLMVPSPEIQTKNLQMLIKSTISRDNILLHEKENAVIPESSESLLVNIHKSRNFSCLIDDHALSRVLSNNPWDVNIKTTLADLQKRLYTNSQIKFRIGGRAIYSASQIVRAKSCLTVEESQQTQDQIQIQECDMDDLGTDVQDPQETIPITQQDASNAIISAISLQSRGSTQNSVAKLVDSIADLSNFNDENAGEYSCCDEIFQVPEISGKNVLYHEDSNGDRFLKAPNRQVFRHLEFNDLTNSLVKTLRYHINRPQKLRSKEKRCQDLSVSAILPENILKKAEEDRALIEEQIQLMYDRVVESYQNNHPVSFLSLIISADVEGIVRTLLYLLHLVNRKKIDLWQEWSEVASESTKRNPKNSKKTPLIDSPLISSQLCDKEKNTDGSINIFITPRK